MATTVTGKITGSLSSIFSKSLDVGSVDATPTLSISDAFTNGTGANKIEAAIIKADSIAASDTEDIDLAGVIADPAGDTVTMTKVKGFLIKNTSTSGDGISIGGTFISWLGAAGDLVKLPAGASLMVSNPSADGYAVTAGSADIITLTNLDALNAQTYEIEVIGETS